MNMTQEKKSNASPTKPPIQLLDITVLAGGDNEERDISLQSGGCITQALKRLGHRVEQHDVDATHLSALDRHADFIFIALHGRFGEDGTIQKILNQKGKRYSGCGSAASSLAMDKVRAKQQFISSGLPTPSFVVARKDNLNTLPTHLPLPAVVKPVSSGSSVDTFLVKTAEQLKKVAGDVAEKYGQALVEQFIDGPELTVGILGNQALPVCEIRTSREFYDYEAKYLENDTQYLFDIALPEKLLSQIQSLSLATHQALGCQVMSRVDWLVDSTTGRPYLLEINTIPGFTSHSLLPKAAARMGIDFDNLCQAIVADSYLIDRSCE